MKFNSGFKGLTHSVGKFIPNRGSSHPSRQCSLVAVWKL